MNLEALLSDLQAHHLGKMQNQAHCVRAVEMIREGLGILSSLGHHFRVEEGLEVKEPWPRQFFKHGQPPRSVASVFELQDLGPGWFDNPGHAEEYYGRSIQFNGRGGIRSRNLPSVIVNSL
jgi:hypothetical protein